MQKIVIASKNEGKIREFREMFSDFEVIPFSSLGDYPEIEETGTTFFENALLKAKTVCEWTGLPALADDSGLSVDKLGGAPGVYSARFSGKGTEGNIERLLHLLSGVPERERTAKFVCSLVYFKPDGTYESSKGETTGRILLKKEGNGGFGYDPVFYSDDLKKSFGQATEEEKNAVSHRARALKKMRELLK